MSKKRGRRTGANGSVASRSDLGNMEDLEREKQEEVAEFDSLPVHRLSAIQHILIVVSVAIAVYLLIGSSSRTPSSRNEPFYSHRIGKQGPAGQLPCKPQKAGATKTSSSNNTTGWQPPSELDHSELYIETCDIVRKPAKKATQKKFGRNDIRRKKFDREYRHQKPLIIQFEEGADAWSDPEKWTLPSLLGLHGSASVGYSFNVDKMDEESSSKLRRTSLTNFVLDVMDLRDPSNQSAVVLEADFLSGTTPGCNQTISPPSFLNSSYGYQQPNIYLGASRSGVAFHRGQDEWIGVVHGSQRWLIYPPERTPPGGVWPVLGGASWLSQVYGNLSREDRPMQCVLTPGEILYIPELWYRAVINMGDTVAIGFSSKNVTSPLAQLWNRVSEIEANARLEKHQKHALIFPILLELHGIYPENTEIVSLLGENYAARGDFISAINTTLEAVEKDPLLLGGHLNLGKLYFAAGLPDKAEDHFLTAMQISPTNAELCRLYGQFLVYQKKTEDAVRLFREGARHNPDLEESFLKLARQMQKVQRGGPISTTVTEADTHVRPTIVVI